MFNKNAPWWIRIRTFVSIKVKYKRSGLESTHIPIQNVSCKIAHHRTVYWHQGVLLTMLKRNKLAIK